MKSSSYNRVNWKNLPSTATPINEANLNKMDAALGDHYTDLVYLDLYKLGLDEAGGFVKGITYNQSRGDLTIEFFSGSSSTINLGIQRVAVNFYYDPDTEQLVITNADGTKQYVDLSALVKPADILDSDQIHVDTLANKQVLLTVKPGSIEAKHMNPNLYANMQAEATKAVAAASAAQSSRDLAITAAEDAAASAETARQYKEEAFDVTPQGYEDIANKVHDLPSPAEYNQVAQKVESLPSATELQEVKTKAETAAGIISNPNLLDNPFFTVNSRGQSSYNLTTSSGYGVDRWKCAQGLVTEEILQNGIRFTATSNGAQMFQYTEPIYFENETKLTLSVDTISADDTYLIFYKNKAWTSQMGTKKTGGISTLTVTIPANTTCSIGLGFYMTGVGKTISIRSVKMEYGTVSTIANDSAPDYEEDLLRCKTSKADSADTYANKGVATGDAWQSTKSYTSGQGVIHNNVLYRVKTNCTGIEPPNATYYEPTSVTEIISNLGNLKSVKIQPFSGTLNTTYGLLNLGKNDSQIQILKINARDFSGVIPYLNVNGEWFALDGSHKGEAISGNYLYVDV